MITGLTVNLVLVCVISVELIFLHNIFILQGCMMTFVFARARATSSYKSIQPSIYYCNSLFRGTRYDLGKT